MWKLCLFLMCIAVPVYGASITFYGDAGYNGQSRTVTLNGSSCYNLGTFANQASSIKATQTTTIVAYKVANCGGYGGTLTTNIDFVGDWNDLIVSFAIFTLPPRNTAIFYSWTNYEGQPLVIPFTGQSCYTIDVQYGYSMQLYGAYEGIRAYTGDGCTGHSVVYFSPALNFADYFTGKVRSFSLITKINPASIVNAAPQNDPSYGVCKAALIIDNYIVRNLNATLTSEQIIRKYTSYFSDLTAYYLNTFNMKLYLGYIYLEERGSFTDILDGGQLLDFFTSTLNGNGFPNQPRDLCISHLLTSRNTVTGISWVDAACNGAPGGGASLSVDTVGQDGGGIVVRRMAHEIAHSFDGHHPDWYTTNIADGGPPYTMCSVNDELGSLRIMKRTTGLEPYTFLESMANISQCTQMEVKNSLVNFKCLYANNPTNLMNITFYSDIDFGGWSYMATPRWGRNQCYNNFQLQGLVTSINCTTSGTAIITYPYINCRGTGSMIFLPASYVGAAANDKITSWTFAPPGTTQSPTSEPLGTGLRAWYYNGTNFNVLVATRVDPTINNKWDQAAPNVPKIGADLFSVRWKGQVKPTCTGVYTFQTSEDDGIRLWVNNQLLIDDWTTVPKTKTATISLNAGTRYTIQVDYFENTGGAVATLSWSQGTCQPLQIIPQYTLYPASP